MRRISAARAAVVRPSAMGLGGTELATDVVQWSASLHDYCQEKFGLPDAADRERRGLQLAVARAQACSARAAARLRGLPAKGPTLWRFF